jgi:3-phenylpropionate/trans-cinnamate dioxygenase ferredoxin component
MAWHKVARLDDIPPNGGRTFEPGGREVAVFRCGGAFFAVSAMCTHASGYLHEGAVDEERFVVECPLHFAEFDLRTGEVLAGPADEALDVYPVKLEGDEVLVELPD